MIRENCPLSLPGDASRREVNVKEEALRGSSIMEVNLILDVHIGPPMTNLRCPFQLGDLYHGVAMAVVNHNGHLVVPDEFLG